MDTSIFVFHSLDLCVPIINVPIFILYEKWELKSTRYLQPMLGFGAQPQYTVGKKGSKNGGFCNIEASRKINKIHFFFRFLRARAGSWNNWVNYKLNPASNVWTFLPTVQWPGYLESTWCLINRSAFRSQTVHGCHKWL